ncbi:MAG: hypothetical protein CL489_10610 [Acidobacteria bacterium]|nr:hypothetical protein [Acidobacteriota bacterium]|tara:strand:- start:613 stop:1749 length:1137 start_codon:yes stop_codon:yes gene_type:complete
MSVQQNSNQWVEAWKQNSAKLLGVTFQLSVNIPLGNEVKVKDLRDAIISSTLPDHWAPTLKNGYSLYLSTIRELGNTTIKKFDIEPSDNFNVEEHDTYTVTKVFGAKHEQEPAKHRVHHKRKVNNAGVQDDNGKMHDDLADVSFDNSVLFILERVKGTSADDDSGDSEFEITCVARNEDNEPVDLDVFQPFIRTLERVYNEKLEGTFTSKQVRSWLADIVNNKLKADNIHRGTYFVPVERLNDVYTLANVLKSVHPGISIFITPIVKFENVPVQQQQVLNQSLGNVQTMLGDSILQDTQSLLDDLYKFVEKDKEAQADDKARGVRLNTWIDRTSQFDAIKKKVEEYKNRELLISFSIEDAFEEIEEILTEKLQEAASA